MGSLHWTWDTLGPVAIASAVAASAAWLPRCATCAAHAACLLPGGGGRTRSAARLPDPVSSVAMTRLGRRPLSAILHRSSRSKTTGSLWKHERLLRVTTRDRGCARGPPTNSFKNELACWTGHPAVVVPGEKSPAGSDSPRPAPARGGTARTQASSFLSRSCDGSHPRPHPLPRWEGWGSSTRSRPAASPTSPWREPGPRHTCTPPLRPESATIECASRLRDFLRRREHRRPPEKTGQVLVRTCSDQAAARAGPDVPPIASSSQLIGRDLHPCRGSWPPYRGTPPMSGDLDSLRPQRRHVVR